MSQPGWLTSKDLVATFFVERVSDMIKSGERTLRTPFMNKRIKFHEGDSRISVEL